MNNNVFSDAAILIVDDEEAVLKTEQLILKMNGFSKVSCLSDSREVMNIFSSQSVSLVILDIEMPYVKGTEILSKIKEKFPDTTVIMMTGLNDAETAVRCMKTGAYDYVVKPLDRDRFLSTVFRALEHRESLQERERISTALLSGKGAENSSFNEIITADSRMHDIFRYINAIAATQMPVLITGETGTGKELFAKAIHKASMRKGEFVCINTAGLDDTLFSDSLFGHDRGAFTGAEKVREGLIERAAGGTLFLDEIGDLGLQQQIKLLRLLQERTYFRLGSDVERNSSARIVTATNRSMEELQTSAGFRKDLFYRLKSHHFTIPPLRERKIDIPLLIRHFIKTTSQEHGKNEPTMPVECITLLSNYPFPGNVRELHGLIADTVGRHQGGIISCDNFKELLKLEKDSIFRKTIISNIKFPEVLPTSEETELALVQESLNRTNGNRSMAAELIGLSRQTFREKAKKLSNG